MLYINCEVGLFVLGIGSGLWCVFEGLVFDGMKLLDVLKGVVCSMVDMVFVVVMKLI